MMAQVVGFLPLMWKTRMEFLACGFGLAQVLAVASMWGNETIGGRSLYDFLLFKEMEK